MAKPTTMSRESRHARSRVAALSQTRPADDAELADARRDLRAERLADHVRMTLAGIPPLTDDQRDRIACLLRSEA